LKNRLNGVAEPASVPKAAPDNESCGNAFPAVAPSRTEDRDLQQAPEKDTNIYVSVVVIELPATKFKLAEIRDAQDQDPIPYG
jgi:hypothetical protein